MDKSYIIEEINITRPIGWTTEDESDMLVKNGFDKETADMVFYGVKVGGVVADFKLPIPKTTQNKNGKPCWSEGVLLYILPNTIRDETNEYFLFMRKNFVAYVKDKNIRVGYHPDFDNIFMFSSERCLVGSLVDMHLKLMEFNRKVEMRKNFVI